MSTGDKSECLHRRHESSRSTGQPLPQHRSPSCRNPADLGPAHRPEGGRPRHRRRCPPQQGPRWPALRTLGGAGRRPEQLPVHGQRRGNHWRARSSTSRVITRFAKTRQNFRLRRRGGVQRREQRCVRPRLHHPAPSRRRLRTGRSSRGTDIILNGGDPIPGKTTGNDRLHREFSLWVWSPCASGAGPGRNQAVQFGVLDGLLGCSRAGHLPAGQADLLQVPSPAGLHPGPRGYDAGLRRQEGPL